MERIVRLGGFTFITFLLFVSITVAQEESQVVGVLFTEEEALELFGKVRDSVAIDTTDMNKYLNEAGEYIMFLLKNNDPVISDNKRKVLFNPAEIVITDKQIMHLFSVSKIRELINQGEEMNVQLENRDGFFTISNGNMVLEVTFPCPPYCY